MSASAHTPANLGLRHLEGKPFEVILTWLERALRAQEPVPMIVPDEMPEAPILRLERSLSGITREDLREACRVLVRRYIREPQDNDSYVGALLRLAKGFNLMDLVTDIHTLAANHDLLLSLPESQIKSILFALLDLRAALPLEFWKSIASALPGTLSLIAVSGLLGHGYEPAMRVLPALPNEQAVADSLYVILKQHARSLNSTEVEKMAATARQYQSACKPQIKLALEDWLDDHAAATTAPAGANASTSRSALNTALASFFARQGAVAYAPRPARARILPIALLEAA